MASEILYIPPAGGGSTGDIAAVLAAGSVTAPDQQLDFLDIDSNLGTSILAHVIQVESADGTKNIQLQVSADGTSQQITFGNGGVATEIKVVTPTDNNSISFPNASGTVALGNIATADLTADGDHTTDFGVHNLYINTVGTVSIGDISTSGNGTVLKVDDNLKSVFVGDPSNTQAAYILKDNGSGGVAIGISDDSQNFAVEIAVQRNSSGMGHIVLSGPDGSTQITSDSPSNTNIQKLQDASGDIDLVQKSVVVIDPTITGTLTGSEQVVLINASGTSNLSLPNPALFGTNGRSGILYLKRIDKTVSLVSLSPFSSETIDGNAGAMNVTMGQAIQLISDSTNWWIIN